MNKCVFLDRDGVLNIDDVNYTYKLERFFIMDGVIEALKKLKDHGYLLIVITNQSGIAKGVYTHEDVAICHEYLQEQCGNAIDQIYYSQYHETVTESLTKKPGTLLFEKAISKFNIDISQSWMVGDMERDLVPAKKFGLKTILIPHRIPDSSFADYKADSLLIASDIILGYNN